LAAIKSSPNTYPKVSKKKKRAKLEEKKDQKEKKRKTKFPPKKGLGRGSPD